MAQPILSPEEVQEFIQDRVEKNHLLDGNEFQPTQINLAIELAIGEFNMYTPVSAFNTYSFPNKSLLMFGTLAKLFAGQAALLARNHMSYSDGGISVPVEERAQLYQSLAAMYQQSFESMGKAWKIQDNIDNGWGGVSSDYAAFPLY